MNDLPNKTIGIECEFADFTDIWKFCEFINVDFGQHYFSVIDSSVFSTKQIIIDLPNKFNAKYFEELIRKSFFCERLVLHLYPLDAISEVIETYDDFVRSKCELILLIYDGAFAEVYCKNRAWLKTLLQNAKSIPNAIVTQKNPDTDSRNTMYV